MNGTEDWVDVTVPLGAAMSTQRRPDKLAALPLAIHAVKELLRDGLVCAGDADWEQGRFRPWSLPVDVVESYIDRAARELEPPIAFGDLFWLENTPEGDAYAEADLATD
ncbi:hypothetical protein [Haloechinothrix sp. LS1_15]|uniref:hypothetical protein n=1 Tax=Haloechinothrix sp. LS1_15 TaxID=2652248 RepID=UPI002945E421|nr:hypothetical protein [Haloechinothrix sp. LS1_15]MDV6014392.1 hypothetical protein [Haloechinothrix sp. LS1_15]